VSFDAKGLDERNRLAEAAASAEAVSSAED
jgi:hypothetical protein